MSAADTKQPFLELSWESLPWADFREQLRHVPLKLLARCGLTLFRSKATPTLYLVADYDPDVARLLAHGLPDIRRAVLRGVQNLIEELCHVENELEEQLGEDK